MTILDNLFDNSVLSNTEKNSDARGREIDLLRQNADMADEAKEALKKSLCTEKEEHVCAKARLHSIAAQVDILKSQLLGTLLPHR